MVDRPKEALLARLAVEFELVDAAVCARAWGETDGQVDLGDALVAEEHLTADQLALLRALGDFLEIRERDRAFAEAALASGRVSADEIDYAFGAQESAFRRDRSLRRVPDLLVEFGALDEGCRDDLVAQAGGGG